jgi:hypothetical protein
VGPRPSKAPLVCHAALSARVSELVVWKGPGPETNLIVISIFAPVVLFRKS